MRRNDPAAKSFLENREPAKAEVFPEQGRLCANFPHVRLALGGKLPAIV